MFWDDELMWTLQGRIARWSRTRVGAATLFTLIFAVGVILIVVGGKATRWSDYNRSVSAAIGIALVVIAPVAAGERLLRTLVANVSAQVDLAGRRADQADQNAAQARQTAEEAQRLVSSLQERLGEQLNQPRLEVGELDQRASDGDFGSLVSLYDEAHRHRWIYRNGIRVKTGFPNCNWAKMTVEQEGAGKAIVRFSFEEEPFKPINVSADWGPERKAEEFLGEVLQLLQNANCAPRDEIFSNPGLPALFSHALRIAIELHTSPEGNQNIDSIALFIGDKWVATESGLFHLGPPLSQFQAQDLGNLEELTPRQDAKEIRSALDAVKRVWLESSNDKRQILMRVANI